MEILSPFLVKLFLVVTVLLGGGPLPETLPRVYAIPGAQMDRTRVTVCGSGLVVGLYEAQTQRIFLRKGLHPLDNARDAAFLVHEMQHHIQAQRVSRLLTPEEAIHDEREAYEVQDKFLRLFGEKGAFHESLITPCKEK